ncbi:MAG: DNA cytosine methyltransferase [Gemmatimonadales bacterium]|nr:DNA cytosine methyltransferase [Gemmatimonadales bacterium]
MRSWATAVDLFAGAGGFTEGAAAAGVRVLWAANHWPLAVETHAANHPEVEHACQDLHLADWSRVPAHDILLASPCCQGHSRARGKDQAHHDSSRSTAWAVVSCAEFHAPQFVVVENVPEFQGWKLYPAWRMAMNALGYSLAEHVIDAADVGVPQHRRRLFIVGARSTVPLHLGAPAAEHRPASDVVDFEAGRWSPIERPGRAAATLARVCAGRARHGDRFLVAYYKSERGGRPLSRPLGTLPTRDRFALVDDDRMRMLTRDEIRDGMGFPAGYRLPTRHKDAVHLLGNAVCPPVVAWLLGRLKEAA